MTASRLFYFLALACYCVLAALSLASTLQFYAWRMDPALDDLAALIQLTLLVAANAVLTILATLVAWGLYKRLPPVLRWRRTAMIVFWLYALWLISYGDRVVEGAVLAGLATLGFALAGRAMVPKVEPTFQELALPVHQTPSGLEYQEREVGHGPLASHGRTAVVHYTGWLPDGTQFDSSLDRKRPLEFKVGQGSVIRGWDEGVATMHQGGRRRLIVPPELGYGAAGAGPIPGGATLIFDVELVDVR